MAYTFTPSAASTISVVYGIEDLLDNFILQDLNVTEDMNSYQIPDQKGAIAQIHNLQKHWTLSLTAIGGSVAPAGGAGSVTTIGGITYYIQSCERRATYNDTQKWALQLEAWESATVEGTSTLG